MLLYSTIPLTVHAGNNGPKSMEQPINLVQTKPRSIVFPCDPKQSIFDSLANLGCWLGVWRDNVLQYLIHMHCWISKK